MNFRENNSSQGKMMNSAHWDRVFWDVTS